MTCIRCGKDIMDEPCVAEEAIITYDTTPQPRLQLYGVHCRVILTCLDIASELECVKSLLPHPFTY